MDYFGISYNEMEHFKERLVEGLNLARQGYTQTTLGLRQWLDLYLNNGQSINDKNITSPGYIEYGAFLKFEKNTKSKMTLDKVVSLFTFNEFGHNGTDDSASILNKYNMDQIFSFTDEKDSIKYINDVLKLSDMEESKNFWEYLNYISGEMAFGFKRGGNQAIGAIADFMSQAMFQVLNGIGWDLYQNLVYQNLYENFFKGKTCIEAMTILLKDYKPQELCDRGVLDPAFSYEKVMALYKGVIFGDQDLAKLLGIKDYEYGMLMLKDSPIVSKFTEILQPLFDEYHISSSKSVNLTRLAANQWINASVTSGKFSTKKVKSVKDWNKNAYNKPPEFSVFCEQFGFENTINVEDFIQIANFDHLFSSKWIQDAFIEYNKKNTTSEFYKKPFISYIRYIMHNKVLHVFANHSVYELIWGYEDEFLNMLVKFI